MSNSRKFSFFSLSAEGISSPLFHLVEGNSRTFCKKMDSSFIAKTFLYNSLQHSTERFFNINQRLISSNGKAHRISGNVIPGPQGDKGEGEGEEEKHALFPKSLLVIPRCATALLLPNAFSLSFCLVILSFCTSSSVAGCLDFSSFCTADT